ncbi:S-formylglutathione hydrolase FrmB [Arcanobacterium phocae]|uniref:S-formylglutathione hydrolase FrmB n=1 Tax=Arcanobacterium phocae TaxID=131112 RepID=A0A1H2LHN0_9ACTO|nr:alpha/beta hydrolase-fold protein [Arcanobacterium phocae]SDU80118.1 S-formylglutathione hydrolase FrmB [Arcanobacterium phocae]
MDFLDRLVLVGMVPAIIIYVVTVLFIIAVCLLTLKKTSNGSRLGGLVALVAGLVIASASWFYFIVWPAPFPGLVPWEIFIALFAAVTALIGMFTVHGRRFLLAIITVFASANTYLVANLTYEEYASIGSFFPRNITVEMSYNDFLSRTKPPQNRFRDVGALVTIPLKGTDSGLNARDAWAYIPPAYWTHPELDLPVVVLLHGNPGSPQRWFAVGDAAIPADHYQRDHDGISPILVSVDATGSWSGDPACVDGPEIKMQTYLGHDVPQLIKERLRVDPDQSHWTLAGLSYGGTCSLQVVTNAPTSYGAFINLSGYEEPMLTTHEETVNTLFHGDEDAFQKINPKDIFERAIADNDSRFSGITAVFLSGDADVRARTAQRLLSGLAKKAGMDVDSRIIPGNHGYGTWRRGFQQTFEIAVKQGGLPRESNKDDDASR